MESNIIHSVLGFNKDIEIKDHTGQPIKTGARTVYPNESFQELKYRILDVKFFTNFNQGLLDKIRACRKCS
jgi:hypothetical protein